MKRWQSILNQHCVIEVLDDNRVKVLDAVYDPSTKESFDDYVTLCEEYDGYFDHTPHVYIVDTVKQSDKYEVVETSVYETINEYLQY